MAPKNVRCVCKRIVAPGRDKRMKIRIDDGDISAKHRTCPNFNLHLCTDGATTDTDLVADNNGGFRSNSLNLGRVIETQSCIRRVRDQHYLVANRNRGSGRTLYDWKPFKHQVRSIANMKPAKHQLSGYGCKPISNSSGNMKQMLKGIVAVGNDELALGSKRVGSILIEHMSIAGE